MGKDEHPVRPLRYPPPPRQTPAHARHLRFHARQRLVHGCQTLVHAGNFACANAADTHAHQVSTLCRGVRCCRAFESSVCRHVSGLNRFVSGSNTRVSGCYRPVRESCWMARGGYSRARGCDERARLIRSCPRRAHACQRFMRGCRILEVRCHQGVRLRPSVTPGCPRDVSRCSKAIRPGRYEATGRQPHTLSAQLNCCR